MAVKIPLTRNQFGAIVSRLCATEPSFAARLDALDPLGTRPIIPAIDTDTVVEVTDRVARAGREATIVTFSPGADGKLYLKLASLLVTVNEESSDDHDVPMTRACTIGDLLTVLLPGTSMTYRFGDEELFLDQVTEEVVEDELTLAGK